MGWISTPLATSTVTMLLTTVADTCRVKVPISWSQSTTAAVGVSVGAAEGAAVGAAEGAAVLVPLVSRATKPQVCLASCS